MKTIGIKLADGSFYPIMPEGTAEKKELSLTTVKDNQTTVQVDLYRSESGTMEDAEYVDTLEIKNLVKHPNGEPDISLDLSLDENNELKAELHDPETGKDSKTTVDLVSRTLEQRSESSDVTLAETDNLSDDTVDGLTFDAENFDLDESLSSSVPQETFDSEEDLAFDPNSLNVDSIVEEESSDTPAEDSGAESSDSDFSMDDLSIPDDFASDESSETAVEETTTAETTTPETSDDNFSLDDFTIPDGFDSNDSFETTSETEEASNDFASNDAAEDDFNFDFPETETTEESSESASGQLDDSGNAGLDFSDILDKETREGHAGRSEDTVACHKKAKAPVIICIVCAVICILAVILILFVIPSNVNLLCKNKNAPAVKQTTAPAENAAVENAAVEVVVEQPKYEAKENEIVVAPAEAVVPEVPKQKAPKGKNITYKIKWGDTLWDISKSYYNNPWKYPKIAKYNGIKNPDHIISGTTIIIPAE